MSRPTLLFVAALALGMTAGCGSSAIELTHDEYERLPPDYKQEIFDAENDLVIARNRQDDAADRKEAAERALADLGQQWKRTTQALTAANQGAKVSQARKVLDAKVAYATSLIDVASAGINRAAAETRRSRAQLDLVRQRQLARIGRATLGSLKPLEETVKELTVKLTAASAAEVDLRTRVQTQLNAWKVAEDAYASASGDYDTGVWGE